VTVTQEKTKIGGILETQNVSMFSILSAPNQPGIAGRVLSFLGDHNVSVEFITESNNLEDTADIAFCYRRQFEQKVNEIASDLIASVGARSSRKSRDIAIIGVYGPHFKEKPQIAGRFCSALGQAHINILGISSSISSVSCIIKAGDLDKAREAVLAVFALP